MVADEMEGDRERGQFKDLFGNLGLSVNESERASIAVACTYQLHRWYLDVVFSCKTRLVASNIAISCSFFNLEQCVEYVEV